MSFRVPPLWLSPGLAPLCAASEQPSMSFRVPPFWLSLGLVPPYAASDHPSTRFSRESSAYKLGVNRHLPRKELKVLLTIYRDLELRELVLHNLREL